jgi:hypothetical protein
MATVRLRLATVLALFVLAALSVAAEAGDYASTLQKGSQALQFGVGYDFKLSPFQGATISYERFVRDRLALRVGAHVSTRYSDGPHAEELQVDVEAREEVDLTDWQHDYSLSCQLVSYREGRVALHYGGGPRVTYSNYYNEDFYLYGWGTEISSRSSSSWSHSWGVGLGGLAGVHWVLNDRFRLQAQYATTFMYGRDSYEYVSTRAGDEYERQTVTGHRDFIQFIPQEVQLGLSVSF